MLCDGRVTVGPGLPVIRTKYSGDLVALGMEKEKSLGPHLKHSWIVPRLGEGCGRRLPAARPAEPGLGVVLPPLRGRNKSSSVSSLPPSPLVAVENRTPLSVLKSGMEKCLSLELQLGSWGGGFLSHQGLGLCGPLLSQHESIAVSTRPRTEVPQQRKWPFPRERRWSWVGGIPQQGTLRAGRRQRVGTPTPGRGQSGGSSSGSHRDMCSALSSFEGPNPRPTSRRGGLRVVATCPLRARVYDQQEAAWFCDSNSSRYGRSAKAANLPP